MIGCVLPGETPGAPGLVVTGETRAVGVEGGCEDDPPDEETRFMDRALIRAIIGFSLVKIETY